MPWHVPVLPRQTHVKGMISPVHGQFTALKNKNMSYIVIHHVSINSNVSLLNLSGRDIHGVRPAQGGTITICFFSPKSENSLSKKCTILTDLFSEDLEEKLGHFHHAVDALKT